MTALETPLIVENFRMNAALTYAGRGWPVFPIHSPKVGPTLPPRCSCGNPNCSNVGKHPMTPNGLKDATCDPAEIRAWWSRWPAANVGLVAGKQSGFVVLDVDSGKGGSDSLAALMDEHGELPETVEADTGGGGKHLLLLYPGFRVPNSVGEKGWLKARGLDIRGDGGYIVAAPSLHASGRRYAWVSGAAPEDIGICAMPGWMRLLVPRPDVPKEAPRCRVSDEAGRYWLQRALALVTEGNRNDTGHWLACQLRDAGLSQSEADPVMRDYAARCPQNATPYPEHEALASLRSAYSRPARQQARRSELAPSKPAISLPPATLRAGVTAEMRAFVEGVKAKRIISVHWPYPLLTQLTHALTPGSVTMLCGEAGVGKTFLILECLRFWHDNAINPVVFFIEKDRLHHVRRLLAQLKGDGRYVDWNWFPDNCDALLSAISGHEEYLEQIGSLVYSAPDQDVTLGTLLQWVHEQAASGKRIILIDPITAADAGENRYREDEKFIKGAQRALVRYGASLVLVTHPKQMSHGGKSANPSAHQMAGGSAYLRFVDTVIWLQRTKTPRLVRCRHFNNTRFQVKTNLFFQLMKTRDAKGKGYELAFIFGDGLLYAEQGVVLGEVAEQ